MGVTKVAGYFDIPHSSLLWMSVHWMKSSCLKPFAAKASRRRGRRRCRAPIRPRRCSCRPSLCGRSLAVAAAGNYVPSKPNSMFLLVVAMCLRVQVFLVSVISTLLALRFHVIHFVRVVRGATGFFFSLFLF